MMKKSKRKATLSFPNLLRKKVDLVGTAALCTPLRHHLSEVPGHMPFRRLRRPSPSRHREERIRNDAFEDGTRKSRGERLSFPPAAQRRRPLDVLRAT